MKESKQIQNYLKLPSDPFSIPVNTIEFEKRLASFFGTKEAIAVSSGTAAIHCALATLNIGPGDEVLVPSLAVVMSAVPVLYQKATPVFVDSQKGGIDFDYDDLKRKVSIKSKAILPVYLWGYSYNIHRLVEFAQKNKLTIIEDACQAHGSKWCNKYLGTWGTFGCFSMRDGKLLATGEGGFILTNNSSLAQKCRAFRSHWANSNPNLSFIKLGHNYRITELQAILGIEQLNRFEKILSYRKWQAQYIRNALNDFPLLKPYTCQDNNEQPNFYNPLFLLDESLSNTKWAKKLSNQGVRNSVGTFNLRPIHTWPVFNSVHAQNKFLSQKQNVCDFLNRAIAISLLQHYTEQDLKKITTIIKDTIKNVKG